MLGIHVGRELRTLGHHHDAEIAPATVPQTNSLGDLIDVEGDFRDQDDICASSNAAVHGNPARVTPHHFYDHHPVVGLGGSVHAVDCTGGYVHGGIKAEGVICAREVIVYSLGDTDNLNPLFMEPLRNGERVVTSDCN